MSIETVVDFVNTLDVEAGDDVFVDPTVLGRWLNRRGLIAREERITSRADLRRALEVREAVRALVASRFDEPPVDGMRVLEEAGRRARYALEFGADGGATLVATARGIDGALGRILATLQEVRLTGDWGRLKACANQGCQWAFYDESRNQSRRWCRMEVCGNRAKVHAHRARQSA